MIYGVATKAQELLRERGFPVGALHFGERFDRRASASMLLAWDRNLGTPEIVEPPAGARQKPRTIATRMLAGKVICYAKASKPGARQVEHEFEIDQLVDATVVAIGDAVAHIYHVRGQPVAEARSLTPEERDAILGPWPGIAYSVSYFLPHPVLRVNYDGTGLKQFTLAASMHTVEPTLGAS
jgi:hypothetical protein